jgi:hypothetical protein
MGEVMLVLRGEEERTVVASSSGCSRATGKVAIVVHGAA